MNRDLFARRKSYIEVGEIFFWTATINNWQRLLFKDEYKNVIINSLNYLSDSEKIDVFSFVIMPNHIHLIWRINEMNGKETSQGSFLKYTAHEFKKMLKADKENSPISLVLVPTNRNGKYTRNVHTNIKVMTNFKAKIIFAK